MQWGRGPLQYGELGDITAETMEELIGPRPRCRTARGVLT